MPPQPQHFTTRRELLVADTVKDSKQELSNKDNNATEVSRRIRREIRRFLKTVDSTEAPAEEKEFLLRVYDSLAQYLADLNRGQQYISRIGHIQAEYDSIENVKKFGVMYADGKGKIQRVKPSRKGLKKYSAKSLKEIQNEHYLIPAVEVSERFFREYIAPARAKMVREKKPSLSEGAFGAEKGGLLDG